MTEKRFKVAVYDENAINGFAVLDLHKPNFSKRLKYENVYIGSKEGCKIVCNFGNSLAEENELLKRSDKITDLETKIMRLKTENKELNDTVKRLNDNINELLEVDFEEDLLKENKELKEENEQSKMMIATLRNIVLKNED